MDRSNILRSHTFCNDRTESSKVFNCNKTKKISITRRRSMDSEDHLIILDWDDTLFPSTYLLSHLQCITDENCSKITEFHIKENTKNELSKNLHKIGRSTLSLLRKLIHHFKASNIKIVTNAMDQWVPNSLSIASIFSKKWRKINDLLLENDIEIMYARNDAPPALKYTFWKIKCYDDILCRFDSDKVFMNVLTVGDQWHDHNSFKRSRFYNKNEGNICHHQIKFMEDVECDYLNQELKYIRDLMEPEIISTFENEGIILEFDG